MVVRIISVESRNVSRLIIVIETTAYKMTCFGYKRIFTPFFNWYIQILRKSIVNTGGAKSSFTKPGRVFPQLLIYHNLNYRRLSKREDDLYFASSVRQRERIITDCRAFSLIPSKPTGSDLSSIDLFSHCCITLIFELCNAKSCDSFGLYLIGHVCWEICSLGKGNEVEVYFLEFLSFFVSGNILLSQKLMAIQFTNYSTKEKRSRAIVSFAPSVSCACYEVVRDHDTALDCRRQSRPCASQRPTNSPNFLWSETKYG